MKSRTTPDFWQCYRKSPDYAKGSARQAYQHFRANPAHPGLSLERLTSDPRLWSVRVGREHRAVGIQDDGAIIWFWIGNHGEFDRRFRR